MGVEKVINISGVLITTRDCLPKGTVEYGVLKTGLYLEVRPIIERPALAFLPDGNFEDLRIYAPINGIKAAAGLFGFRELLRANIPRQLDRGQERFQTVVINCDHDCAYNFTRRLLFGTGLLREGDKPRLLVFDLIKFSEMKSCEPIVAKCERAWKMLRS